MKSWAVLLLFAFMKPAEAGIQHTSGTVEEDGPKGAYRPEPIEHAGNVTLGREEVEDAPNTVINVSDVAGGSPGGGLLRIDPKLVKPKDPPQTWWQWFTSFF